MSVCSPHPHHVTHGGRRFQQGVMLLTVPLLLQFQDFFLHLAYVGGGHRDMHATVYVWHSEEDLLGGIVSLLPLWVLGIELGKPLPTEPPSWLSCRIFPFGTQLVQS